MRSGRRRRCRRPSRRRTSTHRSALSSAAASRSATAPRTAVSRTVPLTLKPDGSIVIGAPIFDPGTGVYTTLCQVVAEEMQVPFEDVAFEIVEHRRGAIRGRRRRQQAVAHGLDRRVPRLCRRPRPGPRPRRSDQRMAGRIAELSRRGSLAHAISRSGSTGASCCSETGETIIGRASVHETASARMTSFAAQVAEVEVDPETGEVTLLKFTTGHDVGTHPQPDRPPGPDQRRRRPGHRRRR